MNENILKGIVNYKKDINKIYLFYLGHGSNRLSAIAEFVYIVDLFKKMHPHIETGYWMLEFGKTLLVNNFKFGFNINLIVPIMLFSSKHIKYDVCMICNFLQSRLKSKLVIIVIGPCINLLNAKLICALLKQSMFCKCFSPRISTTMLILVCRGGSDINANALAYSIARLIWEGVGLGWCEVAFIGVTYPLVKYIHAIRCTSSIIILPFLLFYGELYNKLNYTYSQFIITGYIFSNIQAVLMFFKHVRAVFNDFSINECALCKHRLSYNLQYH